MPIKAWLVIAIAFVQGIQAVDIGKGAHSFDLVIDLGYGPDAKTHSPAHALAGHLCVVERKTHLQVREIGIDRIEFIPPGCCSSGCGYRSAAQVETIGKSEV